MSKYHSRQQRDFRAYQLRYVVMYTLMIGPKINPMLATIAQRKIIQTRPLELNMSSMLPATMIVGIADRNPETTRPTMTPAIDGTTPTMRQKML